MRTISLLLLVAITALVESRNAVNRHAKQDLLVRSKRRWVLSTINVQEEDPGPYPKVISQMFNDKTSHPGHEHKFRLSGMGVTKEPKGVFSVDDKTGVVYCHESIDREKFPLFHIQFEIVDANSGRTLDRALGFDVEIDDINDNAPIFSPPQMSAEVKENMTAGSLPVRLQATDADQRNHPNSKITITMLSQNPQEPKIAVRDMGGGVAELTFEGCFDYDKIKKYEVIVQANDHGTPSLSSSTVITLNIVDSNTYPPMFKKREYHGEVSESTTQDDVLRIAVEDKDTQTSGWRAIYYFIKGNEEGQYKLETDPNTNEGILSVIKEMDHEMTPNVTLQIGVKNEEPLFVCKDKSTAGAILDSVSITMKIININDPPTFEKDTFKIYEKEEEPPGKVLFTPKVTDPDSDISKIRYVLLEDPAGWMAIDAKTGQLTSTKKMDRESPFVDRNGTYTVLITAIDDGEPEATATCTVLVHLGDINDNTPQLVNKSAIMCANKVEKVMVPVKDLDSNPFSGPFTFSLGGDDNTLEQLWKLDPYSGLEGGLISLKTLPYGNYSVPLVIQDQQNIATHDTLEVKVCDCGEGDVCVTKGPPSIRLGAPGIGLIIAGILLFLLLLLLFMCDCKRRFPQMEDPDREKGSLIKYNDEGGGSICKAEPTSFLTPTDCVTVTAGLQNGTKQSFSQAPPVKAESAGGYKSAGVSMGTQHRSDTHRSNRGQSMGTQHRSDTLRSNRGQSMYSNRNNSFKGSSSRYSHSFSLQSNQRLAGQIRRQVQIIDGNQADDPVYRPYEYAYEGQGSKCQSLDGLSLCDVDDDLNFLNDLGPGFKTLGGICQQAIEEKNIQL